MHKRFWLVGRRFGSLVVMERMGTRGTSGRLWLCRCDCGREIKATTGSLNHGNPQSCGCGQRAAAARVCISRSTHGMSHMRLYNIWRGMLARCSNPKNIGWKDYGGRGIRVCNKWRQFEAFRDWAAAYG